MSGHAKKSGFSLPELMIGMVALAIVSLTVGLLLVHGWKGWKDSRNAVAMQQDSSLAREVIGREVRCSAMEDIALVSDSHIVFRAGGVRTNAEAILLSGRDLIHRSASGDFILINDLASDFTVSTNQNSVTVTLDYVARDGAASGSQSFTVYTRN